MNKHIVVETSQQRAFRAFTEGMDRWWLRAHQIGGTPLARIVVEPTLGGRWYVVGEGGREVEIGHVVAWQPPSRLVLTWQLDAEWQPDPALVTEVEVQFLVEGPRQTRASLTHHHLERYGDADAPVRQALDRPGGWQAALEAFARAAVASKYLMIYDTVPAGLAKAPLHIAAHIARLDEFRARGSLLMAGPVMDGSGRAFGVFWSREAADEFMAGDPFIREGVVDKATVIEWREALE